HSSSGDAPPTKSAYCRNLRRRLDCGQGTTISSNMPNLSARPARARLPAGRWLPLLCAISCLFVGAASRAAERRYYFDDINSENGLAQHTVNAFLQDRSGYLWIATQAGVHQSDGYR